MYDTLDVEITVAAEPDVAIAIRRGECTHTVDHASDALKYHPSSGYVQTIVSASVAEYFVSFLPAADARLIAVFWTFEGAMLRVWTVIEQSDFDFERCIYQAELQFMRRFPTVQCDFYVAFQDGRRLSEVAPTDAHRVFPTDG